MPLWLDIKTHLFHFKMSKPNFAAGMQILARQLLPLFLHIPYHNIALQRRKKWSASSQLRVWFPVGRPC